METPWDKARRIRKSTAQERRLGTMEGGQKTPGSGRIWRFKRDGRLWEFLIEARTTDSGSYRVDKAEFLKIKQEALATPPGLLPAMQVDIQDLQLVVMELSVFQEREMRLAALPDED